MKIKPVGEAFRFLNQIRAKQDGDGSREQSQHHQNSSDQPKEQVEEATVAPDDDQVNAAIEAFQHDAQTQHQGLQASAVGQGPGLKVVLKDGTGGVVRQFTGEEFVRMREAAAKDGRVRGKILDQKL